MKIKKAAIILLALAIVLTMCSCSAPKEKIDTAEGENLILSADEIASNAQSYENAADNNIRSSAVFGEGDTITFSFKEPVTINTVALREKSADCERFNIYSEKADGERILLYSNDIIDDYLYCAFPEAKIEKLVFEVEAAENHKIKLQEIEAYYRKNEQKEFRVHSYYAYWGDGEYFSVKENQEKLKQDLYVVTDIILIGNIYWNEDGTLTYPEAVISNEMKALQSIIGSSDTRVWACILNPRDDEGAIDNKASVNSINNNLEKLTDNITDFCTEYGFAGVDFDWEYPRLPHVWKAYSRLLVNLKPKLEAKGILLSSALGPWGNMMSDEAKATLDYVNVMSYDWAKNRRNQHAEFYTCHYASANYFLNHGFKKEQLVMGVPFYGNSTGEEYSQMSYNAFDITSKGQNVGEVDGREYYFNGYYTIYGKTAFTYDNGFAGMMIWNGQLDLPRESEYSLFNAMKEAIEDRNR
ncbi:MAG: glycosyl hydrolase family 18 protein [Eubacterium sp.]